MKKNSLIFNVFLTLAIIGTASSLYACCEDDDSGILIPKVEPDQQVVEYFNDRFSLIGLGIPSSDEKYKKEVIAISSQEDYDELFWFDEERPDIDFSKNTLVLGQHAIKELIPEELKEQVLYKTNSGYKIRIRYTFNRRGEDETALVRYLQFWGLYPKLENLPISVDINCVGDV